MKLFVYGTLMSGMDSHGLMDQAVLISGKCETADMMSMYMHEGYPFVFNGRTKYRIQGELYNVSSAHFKRLSAYEGEFYYLTVTDVICDGLVTDAHIFMGRGHFAGMNEVGGDFRKFCGV